MLQTLVQTMKGTHLTLPERASTECAGSLWQRQVSAIHISVERTNERICFINEGTV